MEQSQSLFIGCKFELSTFTSYYTPTFTTTFDSQTPDNSPYFKFAIFTMIVYIDVVLENMHTRPFSVLWSFFLILAFKG